MKVIFTGASSFTGVWFVYEMARRGVDVTTTFTRTPLEYDGLRGQRVRWARSLSTSFFGTKFGDEQFLQMCEQAGPVDALCLHGAFTQGYAQSNFLLGHAVQENTRGAREVMEVLGRQGCRRLIWTGTYIESEFSGASHEHQHPLYGESKQRSREILAELCRELGWQMDCVILPHVYGPLQSGNWIDYLMRRWASDQVARVVMPSRVRDHAHVSLLARFYADILATTPEGGPIRIHRPSGEILPVGAFAVQLSDEVSQRTGWDCRLQFDTVPRRGEPFRYANTTPLTDLYPDFDASGAWDAFVNFHLEQLDLEPGEIVRQAREGMAYEPPETDGDPVVAG